MSKSGNVKRILFHESIYINIGTLIYTFIYVNFVGKLYLISYHYFTFHFN